MTTRRSLTDDEIDALADEAERGYDVDQLIARRAKRGRPSLGTAPANVESVRLDPELNDQLAARAEFAAAGACFASAPCDAHEVSDLAFHFRSG